MITVDFVRLMARYNRWQNRNLYAAADALDEAARRADRGAFFKSIHGTLSHLAWGDAMWMSRFDGAPKPAVGIAASPELHADWSALKAAREAQDAAILDWAGRVSPAFLAGELSWFSGALGRDVTAPGATTGAHFFNHQTHHRGQVHAMLTAAGAKPGDTDLFIMPADA
ncbi:MAG: DinB family protein [Rhizobiales bacterium]|nr:DinB family protein [Hyphomicrobiales bacterium]